jgi:exonuclease VII small subunit
MITVGYFGARLMPTQKIPTLLTRCAFSTALLFAGSAFAVLPAHSSNAVTSSVSPALTLKRVTLSSSGVGYFEYEAQVERDATLRLPVKLEQVNDVLKSLVVYDAKGQVGGVSLPGREPLGELLRALPFDAAALGSMPDLLQALRGAQVQVQTGSGAVQGRIMAVTPFSEKSDKGAEVQKHRASLMTATGLQHIVIEDAKAIQFQDEQLRAQIADALAAMSNNRAKDGRTVEIITRGSERRTVRLGFVTSAPIWKTAYRLTVPSQDESAGGGAGSMSNLQGWAVIENMSGQDWRGVELTLTTGKPVAFQQNLYDSVFNARPNVPIEMPGRIVPRADTGTVVAQNFAAAPSYAPAAAVARAARPAAAPAAMLSHFAFAEASAPAPILAQVADLASSQDQGTQVSYRFPLPVSVGTGRSLAVPIIVQDFSAQRLAQYQPQVSSQFPLAAMELVNKSGNGLPPGAVTVYEQGKEGASFLGDAQLAMLPAGESRMLAFALDQKISITSSMRSSNTTTRASVEKATLVIENMQQQIHTFNIKSNHASDQSVVVDVPQLLGYALLAPTGKALGESQGRQRVSLSAPAGTARTHEVTLELAAPQRLPMQNLSAYQLQEYLRVVKDDASAALLRRLLVLRQAIDAQQETLTQANTQLNEQQVEQVRLRESLTTVSRGSELYKRYSDGLNEAENRILAALKMRDAATLARIKLDAELKQMLVF